MGRRPSRIDLPRSSENEKRSLRDPVPDQAEKDVLASRARYEGYGKHKANPHLWGLAAYHGPSIDRTLCEDADFTTADQDRITILLERGIQAGLWGDLESQGDPSMLWTVDDNGWIYELRLTIPSQALFHGYPLRTANAFGQKVIARFEDWVNSLPTSFRAQSGVLRGALRAAIDRYS